jgi:putative nucleotidyltransferase with HDIG domain
MTAPELVAKVKNLPPVSHAALRLVNLLDQPAVSNEDVVEVLRCDNVLTAKLLRACNSPYFGLDEAVASVDQAVLILGHQQILHIVLTLAFGGAMVVPQAAYTVEANELWQHSLVTAMAAESLAHEEEHLDADGTLGFTAGLLHDIGKLILWQALTADQQSAIRERASDGNISRVEAEREVIGTDHGEVGACLLGMWRVPSDIVEAVANHHKPVLEPRPRLSAVIHVANRVAHQAVAPSSETHIAPLNNQVAEELEITEEKLEQMAAKVRESMDKAKHLMSMV